MKIPRARNEPAEKVTVIDESAGDQVHDLALALERAVHGEELRAEQGAALPLGHIAPDHHVDYAGFRRSRRSPYPVAGAR